MNLYFVCRLILQNTFQDVFDLFHETPILCLPFNHLQLEEKEQIDRFRLQWSRVHPNE